MTNGKRASTNTYALRMKKPALMTFAVKPCHYIQSHLLTFSWRKIFVNSLNNKNSALDVKREACWTRVFKCDAWLTWHLISQMPRGMGRKCPANNVSWGTGLRYDSRSSKASRRRFLPVPIIHWRRRRLYGNNEGGRATICSRGFLGPPPPFWAFQWWPRDLNRKSKHKWLSIRHTHTPITTNNLKSDVWNYLFALGFYRLL